MVNGKCVYCLELGEEKKVKSSTSMVRNQYKMSEESVKYIF